LKQSTLLNSKSANQSPGALSDTAWAHNGTGQDVWLRSMLVYQSIGGVLIHSTRREMTTLVPLILVPWCLLPHQHPPSSPSDLNILPVPESIPKSLNTQSQQNHHLPWRYCDQLPDSCSELPPDDAPTTAPASRMIWCVTLHIIEKILLP
jgi:hypothetical protein